MNDKLIITIASHFFEVRPGVNVKYNALVYQFVRKFLKVDIQGNVKTVTTFAAANKERTWFRFHINSLEEFKKLLFLNGIKEDQVTYVSKPLFVAPTITLDVRPKWTAYPEQIPIIEYLTEPVGVKDVSTGLWQGGGPRQRLVGIQTGGGKALPLTTVVQTPAGPVMNGSLKVGDVIYAWDGSVTEVTAVYPQGSLQVFEVYIDDGRKIECCKDHLWGIYVDGDMQRQVVTTDQVRGFIESGHGVRIDLPKTGSIAEHSELNGILKAHSKTADTDKVSYTLKASDKATATAWTELARKCGCYVRLTELNETSFIIFLYKNDGSFGRRTISIRSVWQTARSTEMQCISISHPDRLYIAGDWVVTHNTFTALKALSDIGVRFVVIVLAQFVEKWGGGVDKKGKVIEGDITKVLDIKPEEILVVKGGKSMMGLTSMAVTEGAMDPYKAIVISNRTFNNYIQAFETVGKDLDTIGYMVEPDILWEKLGVGVRLVDEVHMHFHSNYRLDLYTHIPLSISLSATLRTYDEDLMRMYKVAYPMYERYQGGAVKKYTDSFGVLYRIPECWRYKTTFAGSGNYNHTAFEASILKNKEFTNAYAAMFTRHLKTGYKANYNAGNKAIVFAASVDMCTKLSDILGRQFPEYNVKRYVAEDPYQEHYLDPDIRVTTIGSGGTGHDIPGLTDAHLGTAIESEPSNIQAFGRLREIYGKQTRFYWYSCEDIQKQMRYHTKKRDLMREKAKSYTVLSYGTLGGRDERTW